MCAASIENYIKACQENPQSIIAEAENLFAQKTASRSMLNVFYFLSERFAKSWLEVESLRKGVDEGLARSRKIYRDAMKRTESLALQGKPRLYWMAKLLFASLRKHSVEYQLREAEIKLDALKQARNSLLEVARSHRIHVSAESEQLLNSRESAELKSKKHAMDLSAEWNKLFTAMERNRKLKEQMEMMDIRQSISDAAVNGLMVSDLPKYSGSQVRTIDSPRLMTSKLPYVGFSNRPRLMTLVEQSEYSAHHAEQDLEKVREGLRCANEAAVGGRATRVSLEWIEYCRVIVSRYEQLAGSDVTPH